MRKISKITAAATAIAVSFLCTFWSISSAQAEEIDVSYLQTCLKEEGSSLDVVVLMDGSASLRDTTPQDKWHKGPPRKGSDPEKKRGKILKSSLKLLQQLAAESKRPLNVNLRVFGNNSNSQELENLEEHSIDWNNASDGDFDDFVENALYDDSLMTEWASALASAKNQFKQRLGQAALEEKRSCPIMFWITDGAPTDSIEPICSSGTESSIDWFRENNILVLGGLLQPQEKDAREKARQFRPIVTGENCGNFQQGWTRGEVIEANDIGDLAWGFVGLVASIKNLISLKPNNSSFYVDPGSSHIEIFIRGDPGNWSIKSPDGIVICSAESRNERCQVTADAEIGIVTLTIFPENPAKSVGKWTFNPGISNENFQVYGSLNTASKEAQKTQPRLVISPSGRSVELDEGKSANFNAKIVNADGSDFVITAFKNVLICAKVTSATSQTCKSGSSNADLSVTPVTSDKSVSFEAVLTSAFDDSRNYRIAASQKINVIASGVFPTLKCANEGPCKFENLKNKTDKSENTIVVEAAKMNSGDQRIYLSGFTILSDDVEKRGDGHFRFEAQKASGEKLSWPMRTQYLQPGDKVKIFISTDMAGDSEVNGVLKYKVLSGNKEIVRQLNFKFNVGNETNKLVQIALLLVAYLITLGIPYAFLLWSAKRAAVLNVADNELAYVVLPFEIDNKGKIYESGKSTDSTFAPDYKKLILKKVEPNDRKVMIENVEIEIVPPKWNPFSQTHTFAKLSDNFLFSSYGVHEISFGQTSFSSTVLDEALFYFPAAGNITASNVTKQEIISDDTGLDFLDSAYETKISEELEVPSNAVRGSVIFIVSPYVTEGNLNKEKSLEQLVHKLTPIMANFNFAEIIPQLRESSLAQLKAEKEAAAIAATSKRKLENKNKSGIPTSEPVEQVSESSSDEWSWDSPSNNERPNSPESKRNDDEW